MQERSFQEFCLKNNVLLVSYICFALLNSHEQFTGFSEIVHCYLVAVIIYIILDTSD